MNWLRAFRLRNIALVAEVSTAQSTAQHKTR